MNIPVVWPGVYYRRWSKSDLPTREDHNSLGSLSKKGAIYGWIYPEHCRREFSNLLYPDIRWIQNKLNYNHLNKINFFFQIGLDKFWELVYKPRGLPRLHRLFFWAGRINKSRGNLVRVGVETKFRTVETIPKTKYKLIYFYKPLVLTFFLSLLYVLYFNSLSNI